MLCLATSKLILSCMGGGGWLWHTSDRVKFYGFGNNYATRKLMLGGMGGVAQD